MAHRNYTPISEHGKTAYHAHSDPSQHTKRAELREMLRQTVPPLPPTRKRVFFLYYVEELPIKVITTRINRSKGTIKTHLRNARL